MAKKSTYDAKAGEELNQTGEFADNRDIYASVEALANALKDIMTYADNPSGAAFCLKYFISSFYSASYVIENMRQQLGYALDKNDLSLINNLKRRVQYVNINKAFNMYWGDLARAWDKFLEENNLTGPDIPLSEDIVKNRRNYTVENQKTRMKEEAKTILFSLENMI